MAPHLLIFDCDGVLVDSEPIANSVMTRFLREEGLSIDLDQVIERFVGRSMPSCVDEIEALLGRPLAPDWVDRLQAETFERFREELRPVRGVHDVIRAAAELGWHDCVASSGEHEKLTLTLSLTGLLDHFRGRIFSASEVLNGKPAPDLFLHAAGSMGVPAGACTVVEDSEPGVRAALAAGMRAFGYTAGDTDRARTFAALGATPVGDMTDLARGLVETADPFR